MKKIGTCILNIILILLAAYIILMQVCPDKVKNFIGYQPFVILTDSMEPLIPTGSAVLVKNFKEDEEPEENTIISFHVDRLGTPTVFTHYFREKETGWDGRVRYRTQGLSADRYDDYKTYREDLIGTYVGHIPYVGKYILFLQSPFALIELGIILLLIVIYRILWERFDREEQMALETVECGSGTVDCAEATDIAEWAEEEEECEQAGTEITGETAQEEQVHVQEELPELQEEELKSKKDKNKKSSKKEEKKRSKEKKKEKKKDKKKKKEKKHK